MDKKTILSKFNLKDYNNELEDVLETKDFSSNIKNLLLSMLYKIETSYKDYQTSKKDVIPKENLIETIISIIKNNCNIIELIEPQKEEKPSFTVNKKEKKIISYPNEVILLHAILEMTDKKYYVTEEYSVFSHAIKYVLEHGFEQDIKEIITNFDGWSWNITTYKEDKLKCNLIYQNLKMIFSYNFLYEWKNEESKEKDYLSIIKKESNMFYEKIVQMCLIIYVLKDKQEVEYVFDEKRKLQEELSKMQDKNTFLKNIYDNKKLLKEQIKTIDKITSDKDLLIQEFNDRNSELPENEKIFSLSDLEETFEKERENAIQCLQKYNSMLEPKNYLSKINSLNEKIQLVDQLNLKDINNEEIKNSLIELQEEFLKCLRDNLEKTELKKDVIEYIYKFRYYKYIPIEIENKIVKMSEIKEFKKSIEKMDRAIITKACNLKILPIINKDVAYNYKIISKIISTSIINLEDIVVEYKINGENLLMNVYDSEILDRTEEIKLEKQEEFNIKFNKKIKLFI